jgi:hypothetical protein
MHNFGLSLEQGEGIEQNLSEQLFDIDEQQNQVKLVQWLIMEFVYKKELGFIKIYQKHFNGFDKLQN